MPTRGVTSDKLLPIVMEVVRNLECAGFKVLSLTADKAAPNRKFFKIQNASST